MQMTKYYNCFSGRGKTCKDLFDAVDACIRADAALADVVLILDYGQLSWGKDQEVFHDEDVPICYVNTGGSEGVYVDCVLKGQDGKLRNFATYKTLEEDFDAYLKMGMIAGAFTKLAEEYIFANQ